MKELHCPRCKSGDNLQTEEQMMALVSCEAIFDDGPQYDPGEEIIYDSTEISGVLCGCGWKYSGPDWMQQLEG